MRWQVFARSFSQDIEHLLLGIWPELEVDYDQIQNHPTSADPLGAKSVVEVAWDVRLDSRVVRVVVDGDEGMPMLEPKAAETYMLVQWPHLFRRKPK